MNTTSDKIKISLAALLLLAPVALAGKTGISPESYRSVGKQVAPVELVQERRYEATVGERVSVDTDLRLTKGADAVRVEISAGPGLALGQRVLRHELGPRDSGAVKMPPVAVSVLEEGRHRVNITVFMRGAWGERFRSFSVPVSTPGAAKAARTRNDLKSDATGQALRILPAVETN